MALQKLARTDLEALRGGGRGRGGSPEYIAFLKGLRMGEGGKAVIAHEGSSRANVKNRLNAAAKAVGVSLKFHRSGAEELIFEVVDPGSLPARRGRAKKTVAAEAMQS